VSPVPEGGRETRNHGEGDIEHEGDGEHEGDIERPEPKKSIRTSVEQVPGPEKPI
jgi:hypothetical protein